MKKKLLLEEVAEKFTVLDENVKAGVAGGVDFYWYQDQYGHYLVSWDGDNWYFTDQDSMATMLEDGGGEYGTPGSYGQGAGGSSSGTGSGAGGYSSGSSSSGPAGGPGGSVGGTTGGTGGSYGGSTGGSYGGGTAGSGPGGDGSGGPGSTGGSSGTPGGTTGGSPGGDPTYGGLPGGYTGGSSGSSGGTVGGSGSVNQPGGTIGNESYGLSQGDMKTLLANGLMVSGIDATAAEALAIAIAPELLAAAAAGLVLGVIVVAIDSWQNAHGTVYHTEVGTPWIPPNDPYANPNPGGGMDPWPSGNFKGVIAVALAGLGLISLYNEVGQYFGWPTLDPLGNPPIPGTPPAGGVNPGANPNETPGPDSTGTNPPGGQPPYYPNPDWYPETAPNPYDPYYDPYDRPYEESRSTLIY